MHFARNAWGVVAALASLSLTSSLAIARPSMESIIDQTTSFLVRDWITDPEYKDYQPPQVLVVPDNTRWYGACGDRVKGEHVDGSLYCSTHHTIFLVPQQLSYFYNEFGPSSVAYVVAHEFSHAMQARYSIDLDAPMHELQADCLAGVLINIGSKSLGINREDTIQMAQAAYNIGDPTHGTGAQRAYALLGGMGVVNFKCSPENMELLSRNQISDPLFSELTRTRSGAGSADLSVTPYPQRFGDIKGTIK